MKLENLNLKNFTKKQKIKWLILFAILLSYLSYNTFSKGLVLSGKPPINFYKDGKLMWLIDTISKEYSMETIETIKKGYDYYGEIHYNDIEESYENYLVELKENTKYKYDDWRFPSPDELMRLDYGVWYIHKILVYPFKDTEKERSLDTTIFYDKKMSVWSNEKTDMVTSEGYPRQTCVSFENHRFPGVPILMSFSSPPPGYNRNHGATHCDNALMATEDIRMVREREPWRLVVESIPIMLIWIFVLVMIVKIRKEGN